jgi:hypothetical protein
MPAVYSTALVCVVVALQRRFGRSTSVAHMGVEMENRGGSAGVGCWGFGSMLATTISWSVNHSILWMILHGILSWLYVIYYSFKR